VLGVIATVRDVTHHRELERQRELLLSTIVHDLKSPLATIRGMAQLVHRRLVRTHEFPEELREDLVSGLERIDEKVSQMARLIDDVVESGRRHREPHFQKQDILPAIRSICATIDRSEEHHSIRVETSLAELVGEWDRDRLERAVENLVRNAVKYSPDGGTVRVRIDQTVSDRPCEALITVEDHGIGVPESDQARIFERFYRAGNAAGVAAGTGIGLAAVRQAVESHGGTVVLESVEGEGTTVRVRLPLTRA
jgi:signal transduction histidine kinase